MLVLVLVCTGTWYVRTNWQWLEYHPVVSFVMFSNHATVTDLASFVRRVSELLDFRSRQRKELNLERNLESHNLPRNGS